MKFENTAVWGFEHALRGARNPKESWNRSDSCVIDGKFVIGQADMKLAQSLIRAGTEHRKFLRQIFVSVDITAPLYWWKEFDTYKVGTVANSTSTMHKMASKPITVDCFEIDDYDCSLQLIDPINIGVRVDSFIDDLEQLRQLHLQYLADSKREGITEAEKKHLQRVAKKYWKELIRWLPESWLQTRTVTFSYENLLAMFRQRNAHKLSEWKDSFCDWIKTLPYSNELIQYK